MLYRIWFNRGCADPKDSWVIAPSGDKQITVRSLEMFGGCFLPEQDSTKTPSGWIEVHGDLVVDPSGSAIIRPEL